MLKTIVKNVTPPVFYNMAFSAKKKLRNIFNVESKEKLKSSDWYDEMFSQTKAYHSHYTESPYYFLWTVMIDRIKTSKPKSILDIGCGPGQFAKLLSDQNIKKYHGVDFSEKAIKMARTNCPEYKFSVEDMTKSNILETEDYDCIVTMEFLEHIEDDIAILEKIKHGTLVFLNVPNFDDPSHVRHFDSAMDVIVRYSHLFSEYQIRTFQKDPDGKYLFFLFSGTKL